MVPQLIAKLDIHVLEIEKLLGSLNARQLNFIPADGKWSIRQQLAHVGRYHEIFRERIERIKKEENPLFTRYRAEWDPGFKEWETMLMSVLRDRIQQIREDIKQEFLSFSPAILQRQGSHPKLGTMSLETWFEFFLLHESHHLYKIFRMIRREVPLNNTQANSS